MYRLTNDPDTVIQIDTGTNIVRGNWMWDAYEEWLAAGNTPDPLPPVDPAPLLRAERDALLRGCDWTQLPDADITAQDKAAFVLYRQALRDLPEQPGFPDNVTWPTRPQLLPDAGDDLPEYG